MTVEKLIPNRKKLAYVYYGLVIIFLCFRIYDHVLLSQLQQPELTLLGNDPTYILFAFSGLSRFLVQHYHVALLFDVCLVSSAVAALLTAGQKWASAAFVILFGIYIVVGQSYLCFHKHNIGGLWFASLMFLSGTTEGFRILFELIRYYCLYSYANAGFWKFYRGVWNAPGHFSLIVKNDALSFLATHPISIRADVISWLIIHPGLLDKLMMGTCFIQILFVVGYFTKKLDWLFFAFAIAFHIMSLYLLDAYFIEFSVILITLFPLRILYKSKLS